MQNLKKSEKILLVVTAVALFVFAAWRMGLGDALASSGGGGDVNRLASRFEDNLEQLSRMYEIEREFKRVGEFPRTDDANLRPALAFTQQVSDMCRNLGFDFPPIRPEVEAIEGVDDYELINVAVKTEGKFADTVKLLQTFENNGLIFREVDLKATRDRDQIVARITVARIAEKPKRPTGLRTLSRN